MSEEERIDKPSWAYVRGDDPYVVARHYRVVAFKFEQQLKAANQRAGQLTVFLTALTHAAGGQIVVEVADLQQLPPSGHVQAERTADGKRFVITYHEEEGGKS